MGRTVRDKELYEVAAAAGVPINLLARYVREGRIPFDTPPTGPRRYNTEEVRSAVDGPTGLAPSPLWANATPRPARPGAGPPVTCSTFSALRENMRAPSPETAVAPGGRYYAGGATLSDTIEGSHSLPDVQSAAQPGLASAEELSRLRPRAPRGETAPKHTHKLTSPKGDPDRGAQENLVSREFTHRINLLERAAALSEHAAIRAGLAGLIEKDWAEAPPLHTRDVAKLLGLSEKTVRAWAREGVLVCTTKTDGCCALGGASVRQIRQLVQDLRAAGTTAGLLDEVHRRLTDATWAERADLAESLAQMQAGEGTVRVANHSE